MMTMNKMMCCAMLGCAAMLIPAKAKAADDNDKKFLAMAAQSGPDADHQKEWDKLNGLSGKDFDKEYMSDMVSDHAKALSAFTTEAKDTQDAKFRAAVIKGKTRVAAHKNMAYDLKKKL